MYILKFMTTNVVKRCKHLYVAKMLSSFLYFRNNHVWKVMALYLKLIRWSWKKNWFIFGIKPLLLLII